MRPSTPSDPSVFKNCWREPGERPDGRLTLLIRPFWANAEEEAAYMKAVRENPRIVDVEADEIESSTAYIARIAAIVAAGPLAKPAKRIPPKHRMNPEYTGPRTVTEGGLTFEAPYEERLQQIFTEREPGSDDE